jgi:NADH:ubiquinone oxidoreductase subunit F (NADH-binding)
VNASRAALADLLDRAGLTGRGGAAFSTATKLRAALAHDAVLVVNACDGEIGAVKDAWVVARHLDETVAGASLLGSRVRWAAHRGGDTATRLARAGLDVLEVPARYVSSEESSLVSLAHGGLARPVTKKQPVVTGGADSRGRSHRPTLVLNAETVWRTSQVATHGAAWFRAFGTAEEPGPRLVSLHGHVRHPGVLDTAAGVPLSRLLRGAGARGLDHPGSTVLLGGLSGVFLTGADAARATWSTAGLAPWGGRVGSGVVEVLDPHACPLERVSTMLTWAAGESAGQCGPCMFGLPALATDVATLVATPTQQGLDRVRDRLPLLVGRGACRFPDGVAGFAASALRVHADHLAAHAVGRCPSREEARHDQTVRA